MNSYQVRAWRFQNEFWIVRDVFREGRCIGVQQLHVDGKWGEVRPEASLWAHSSVQGHDRGGDYISSESGKDPGNPKWCPTCGHSPFERFARCSHCQQEML